MCIVTVRKRNDSTSMVKAKHGIVLLGVGEVWRSAVSCCESDGIVQSIIAKYRQGEDKFCLAMAMCSYAIRCKGDVQSGEMKQRQSDVLHCKSKVRRGVVSRPYRKCTEKLRVESYRLPKKRPRLYKRQLYSQNQRTGVPERNENRWRKSWIGYIKEVAVSHTTNNLRLRRMYI